jgi:hypothetical protein
MNALRPNFYKEFTSVIEKVDEGDKLDDEQKALAHISRFKGWMLFKQYAEEIKKEIDEMVSVAISTGASDAEIGQRAVVKELTKLTIDRLIERVEDARRATDTE